MSDYIDETPLTDEEIAAAIAAAKKAKAEKARAKKADLTKQEKPERKEAKADKDGASDSLFDEIDSAGDGEEVLSPKMKSAKSFSNAFAAARSKREENLRKKKEEKPLSRDKEEDLSPAQDVDSEDVQFDSADEDAKTDREKEYEEESGVDAVSEFDVDDEDEYYTADGEDSEQVEFDGIFQPDDEETPSYGARVPVDEIEDEYEDSDEDDDYDDEDDEEDSSVSTKTKVIVGVIIAVLILAIIGVGAYFALNGGFGKEPEENVSSSVSDVKSISFSESSISLRIGETAPLNIVIDPADAQDKVLKLKSGDTSIATVDSTGLVTGVSSGSTTITATLKSNETISATIVINVVDEKQNAINVYNKFINSILDGSTDIDSDAEDSEEDTDSDESSDGSSDSDTDSDKTAEPESILTGSIIRDLNDDGELELALYYTSKDSSSEVRIFHLADENAEDSDDEYQEPQYDEYGNLIESSDEEASDTDTQSDTDKPVSEKVITELDIYSEMYSVCYNAIEESESSWDTVYLEIKEGETGKARVTILSEDYKSPTVVYETSDDSVATVDNQGNVKAVGPGSCDITVTSPLNSEAMATVKIKVKDDTDLLDDYLAQIPIVNQTNDAVIPTETLTGKAIVDIDNDGISELLLRFDYGNDVQTINMVKIENEQCVVYKTYNNLSDLYEYYEGKGSYSNSILIHYSTGKVCMEYKAVVAKEDSKTKTSEQKILSIENSGSLSELVKFSTTTDISTKTVTSEVFIDEPSNTSSSDDDVTSSDEDVWYSSSDEDTDDTGYDPDDSGEDSDDYYYPGYMTFSFDGTDTDTVNSRVIDFSKKSIAKTLPQKTGIPDDYPDDDDNWDDDPGDDEPDTSSRLTSTVTSEVTEETTKYFVNGTPVEQSVYEETLSTYSARYAVWSDWESV